MHGVLSFDTHAMTRQPSIQRRKAALYPQREDLFSMCGDHMMRAQRIPRAALIERGHAILTSCTGNLPEGAILLTFPVRSKHRQGGVDAQPGVVPGKNQGRVPGRGLHLWFVRKSEKNRWSYARLQLSGCVVSLVVQQGGWHEEEDV